MSVRRRSRRRFHDDLRADDGVRAPREATAWGGRLYEPIAVERFYPSTDPPSGSIRVQLVSHEMVVLFGWGDADKVGWAMNREAAQELADQLAEALGTY